MRVRKIVVHTDVLLDHLRTRKRPSALRVAMGECLCYTTVFSAIELLALARTNRERELALGAMGAMKILGVNARSALRFGDLVARHPGRSREDIFVAGMCLEAKLPLLTARKRAFSAVRGVRVFTPTEFLRRTR